MKNTQKQNEEAFGRHVEDETWTENVCATHGRCATKKWCLCVQQQTSASPDDIWDIVGKFCGLKLWQSRLEVCEQLEGKEGKPGCVRYCVGKSKHWVKEKLLRWDGKNREYTYIVTENSLGLEEFIATFAVSEGEDGGAILRWSFEVNPLQGQDEERFLKSMRDVWEENMGSLGKTASISR